MKGSIDRPVKPFRIGVLGCGRVFEKYHLPALKQIRDWKLIAICDPLEERVRRIQSSFPGLFAFETPSAFLEQPGLDAVLITTPPATHCQLSIQALNRGLHVLVEKPMALNVCEASLMQETALRAQKQLWVGFNRRFWRPYLHLKEILANLPKERIRAIQFRLIVNSQNWNSVTPFEGDDAQGGGVLDNVASHQLDLLSWLLGGTAKAVKVERFAQPEVGVDVVRYALKFENDLVANCTAGQCGHYSENLEVQLTDRKLFAYPIGVAETRWLPTSLLRTYGKCRSVSHWAVNKLIQRPNRTIESFEMQLNAFAAVIRSGSSSSHGCNARNGVYCVKAIQAIRESLQSGGSWNSII